MENEALVIKNLVKTYPNGVKALKGVDLKVAKGDFFALLGPNGAGKSTTIGIICSLVNKSSGEVTVFGDDLDRDHSVLKTHIGLVPQEFNFGIFEKVINIVVTQAGYYGISRSKAIEKAEHYLKKLDLWEKRNSPARELSGGMKRRLMIARALIHEPQLLILDEPTAGVDIEIRRSTWAFLQELNQSGVTIILTTHYLEEAESLCKNIAIINHGRIIENTSMKGLLAKLKIETFVLDLAPDNPSLSSLTDNGEFKLRVKDEHTLEVDIPKTTTINSLFNFLSEKKINVLSMRNKSNRLEELFLNLTGTTDPDLSK